MAFYGHSYGIVFKDGLYRRYFIYFFLFPQLSEDIVKIDQTHLRIYVQVWIFLIYLPMTGNDLFSRLILSFIFFENLNGNIRIRKKICRCRRQLTKESS